MKFCTFFLSALITLQLFAQGANPITTSISAVYCNKQVFRGALIWDKPIVAVFPSFTFYNTISINQNGLELQYSPVTNHQLTLGFSKFDDSPPPAIVYRVKDGHADHKNQREDTYFANIKYSVPIAETLTLGIEYSRDLKATNGNYFSSEVIYTVHPLMSFTSGISWGDQKNNRYIYGKGSAAGLGVASVGVSGIIPFLPFGGVLIPSYSFSQIVQQRNVEADYIRGTSSNNTVSVLASWTL